MSRPSRPSLAELVSRARTLAANARADAEIAALLVPYGYDDARLATVLTLVVEVETRTADQAVEYGEQYAATSAADAARADLDALFSRHRQLARLAHARGTDGYRTLGLNGTAPKDDATRLALADTFYRVLQSSPALAAAVAPYNLGPAALTDGRARVEAVRVAVAAQAKEAGEAQRATRVRDDAAEQLRAVYRDLVAVAKIALVDVPQLRERLGLLERS